MTKHALEICGLQKSFENFTLHDVSFALPTGFIMGLVGKNGAGKTTIIKLILELLKKERGLIKIFGKEIKNDIDIKQDIAFVFDDFFFIDDWKISDVESAISPFYDHWDSKLFQTYLKQFELLTQKKIKELSKGMKMKLMLAVALSHKAKLLILDEPTSGLDPVARDELLDLLLRYIEDENNSILFSTHITADLNKVADYLTILNNGELFYSGSKEDLFEKYCIVKGGLDILSTELELKLIGVRKSSIGFSALMDVSNMKYLTNEMITEIASIDDILIHVDMNEKEVNYGDL